MVAVASLFRSLVFAALLLVLPASAAAGLAQSSAADYPFSVTDDTGTTATFSAPPQRIISLSPGLTEITFALGHGDQLVAVDTYSTYPPEAKDIQPRLTTYPNPSIEAIVGLRPDLVLSLAERDQDLALIRAQGIPVLKLLPKDFDAAVHTIQALGRVYGSPDAGDAVASDMLSRRDAVVAAVAGASRPRVYEELDASEPDKPFVAGPNGFYGELIDLAGGTNVFADLPGDFGQVGAETIVQRDPEIIVLTDADLPFNPQTPEMVAARPGWNVITAVQQGAIYAVPAELYSTPGPRLVQGLEHLARLLHPERFSAPTSSPGGRLLLAKTHRFAATGPRIETY